jgi:hypothetical protein
MLIFSREPISVTRFATCLGRKQSKLEWLNVTIFFPIMTIVVIIKKEQICQDFNATWYINPENFERPNLDRWLFLAASNIPRFYYF